MTIKQTENDEPQFIRPAGFNVGPVPDTQQKYQINKDMCSIPGFHMLCNLLPRHVDIPEMYHLIIALLLGHPVSGELNMM